MMGMATTHSGVPDIPPGVRRCAGGARWVDGDRDDRERHLQLVTLRFCRWHAVLKRAAILVLLTGFGDVVADGGRVASSQRVGEYHVTVFSSPSPLQAGPADLSVMIQQAASGEIVRGVPVVFTCCHEQTGTSFVCSATHDQATNKLLSAAKFDFPVEGTWAVEVEIGHPVDRQLAFDLFIAHASLSVPLLAWIACLPLILVALYLMRHWIQRRHARPI